MADLAFTIVPDAEDENLHHVKCPHCEALDTIVEQDSAIRWNTLTDVTPTGAVASVGNSGDWEFQQWYCTACGKDAIDQPDDWAISDWY